MYSIFPKMVICSFKEASPCSPLTFPPPSLDDWWNSSTEAGLSLCLLFFLNHIFSHHCQMQLCLFYPHKNPGETRILSPSCLVLLLLLAAFRTNIKINGPKQHVESSGFQVAGQGTRVVPTTVRCDGYPSAAGVFSGLRLF